MIAVQIEGPLHQQLSQYAFGLACANRAETLLKCHFTAEALVNALLVGSCDIVNAKEADALKAMRFLECPQNYESSVLIDVKPDCYFAGHWQDARYWRGGIKVLREQYQAQPIVPWGNTSWANLAAMKSTVLVDFRDSHSKVSASFVREAVVALRENAPDLTIVVVCKTVEYAKSAWDLEGACRYLEVAPDVDDVSLLKFFAGFSSHIVTGTGLSMWGAILGCRSARDVVAPMQLVDLFDGASLPVWPTDWIVLPPRVEKPYAKPLSEFDGAVCQKRPIKVGVSGCYENQIGAGYLFRNMSVPNGHNSLKPWCDLYEYGLANGMEFVTLDQVANVAVDIDALLLLDRPKADNLLSAAALRADIVKIFIIYECPLIKPDNWDASYHAQFDYIFTWGDGLVDGRRYIKNNFVTDLALPHDFGVLKRAFDQRKLLTMINSSVLLPNPEQFPTQLYTHRVRAIRWFEANAKDDFDLYGLGWDAASFPSYKGKVSDKLATLTHYRFALVYENAQGYSGYISEKIQDCLLAGVVPVYGGAPNISQWIPADCYIEINQFKTFDDLYTFLGGMKAEVHGEYMDRIRAFFTNGKAYPFSTECFVSTLTKYIAWGVQSKRGQHVQGYKEAVSSQTHYLYQEPETLKLSSIAIQPKEQIELRSAPTLARAAVRSLLAPGLVVTVGYGPELPVFLRARALWDFYASHFPGVEVVFIRDSLELPLGQTTIVGGDLVVGIGGSKWDVDASKYSKEGYAVNGVWSSAQNERVIHRQIALYNYLLARRSDDFHLFATTVTSVVDFRGLLAILPQLPVHRCYAGLPGTLNHSPYQGVGMVHGANTLVSRDVMELMRERYVPDHVDVCQPNDHWQGIVLKDVPRITLPLFSFNKPRRVGAPLDDVYALTRSLLADGHYHFRVKTSSAQPGIELREDLDPWLMLRVMQAVLDSSPDGYANLALQKRFALACTPNSSYPRDFPIDDGETQYFYRT